MIVRSLTVGRELESGLSEQSRETWRRSLADFNQIVYRCGSYNQAVHESLPLLDSKGQKD